MQRESLSIAAAIHSTWAARGHMPSVADISDVMGEAYEAGRKAGAVEVANRLRSVLKTNYADDRRMIRYSEAVSQAVAVVNNELTEMIGEPINP